MDAKAFPLTLVIASKHNIQKLIVLRTVTIQIQHINFRTISGGPIQSKLNIELQKFKGIKIKP